MGKAMQKLLVGAFLAVLVVGLGYIYWSPSPVAPPKKPAEHELPLVAPTALAVADPGKGSNLIWPSEDFSHPNWGTPENASVLTDVETAPNGTKTADRLVESTAMGVHRIETGIAGLRRDTAVYTFSLFVKPAERSGILFELRDSRPGKYGVARFDLNNPGNVVKANDVFDAGVELAPNGWYRCWVVMPYATDHAVINLALIGSEGSQTYIGDGRSGILIWGAQLEPSNAASPYLATTTEPVVGGR